MVRRGPEFARPAVVMLTSAGQPEDRARCRQLGVNASLMKPIKQSELFDTIVTALTGPVAPPEGGSCVCGVEMGVLPAVVGGAVPRIGLVSWGAGLAAARAVSWSLTGGVVGEVAAARSASEASLPRCAR